jgi:hypothetical protein
MDIKKIIKTDDIAKFIDTITKKDVNLYKESICHMIIHNRKKDMLKILMYTKIDRMRKNKKGETAFHVCCKKNWLSMAKILLFGNDGKKLSHQSKKLLTMKNYEGKTVYDLSLKSHVFQWLNEMKDKYLCEFCLLESGNECDEHLCLMCYSQLSECTVCGKKL